MAKASKIRDLAPEDDVSRALHKIVQVRVREIRRYQAIVLRAPSPEAVHDFRVAVRRLFSLLKIFSQYFPGDSYEEIRSVMKELLGLFGHVREIDVFQEMIGESSLARKHPQQPFVRRIYADKQSIRNEAAERSLEYLRSLENAGLWHRLESTFS